MSIKPSTEKHHKIPNCSIGATCKVYQDLGGGGGTLSHKYHSP